MSVEPIVTPNDPHRKVSEYVQKALSGESITPSDPDDYGVYAPVVEGVDYALRHGGLENGRKAFEAMCRTDASLNTLMPTLASPNEESDEDDSQQEIGYPRLPDNIIPAIPDESAGTWLDHYTNYAEAKSPMTPRLFHQSAGLNLLSIGVARRLVLHMSFDDIYPNLFIAWIAATTIFRKTTALNIARTLAFRVFLHLVAPQESTPEALLSDMAGVQPSNLGGYDQDPETLKQWQAERNYAAQRGFIQDEMSGLLASAGKDYNAGLLEFLLKAYDCEPQYVRSTRSQGRLVIRNTYASFIGASTPAAMWPYLRDAKLWSMGWWPRFALLTPDVETPAWKVAADTLEEPCCLVDGLQELYQRLPAASWGKPPEALTVSLGTGVFPVWQRYYKALSYDLIAPQTLDERLIGTYGRLATQALKIATLLAAIDWPQHVRAPHIELPHLVKALNIAETWRASAHRTIAQATRSTYGQTRLRILKVLGRHESEGASMRDITRVITNLDPVELNGVLIQMKMTGEIEELRNEVGRPTVRYRIVRD